MTQAQTPEPSPSPTSAEISLAQPRPEILRDEWPREWYGSILEPAVLQSEGKFHVDHVLDLCAEGKMQLWAAWRDSDPDRSVRGGMLELLGVMVTEIVDFPGKRVLSIPLLAGCEMQEWLHHYPKIEAWAKEQGCREIEILGRKGWERVMAPLGFGYSYTALAKEI